MKKTIASYLEHWANKQPEKTAFIFPEAKQQLSYAQLLTTTSSANAFFDKQGIKPKSIVASALPNSKAMLELLLSTMATGRIFLPLNLVSGKKALQYVLNHARPSIIFVDEERSALIESLALDFAPKIEKIACFTEQSEYSMPNEQDEAMLMYTSGTTGNPKGVILTHGNMIAGGGNTVTAHELSNDDIGMCVLPLFHINAQCVSVMSTLVCGSTLVLSEQFSVSAFFPTIEKYRITWTSVVPTMVNYLIHSIKSKQAKLGDFDLTCLQFIRSASAPLPVEAHQVLERHLNVPVIETMGITETAAQILSNPRPPQKRKIGTVGLPFGNKVRVADNENRPCRVDEEGEIQVQGDNVMQRYYKNTEASAEAFTTDKWYRSGDLAVIDADGYIKVTGRMKELIIKGGENIAPREIDEVLYTHPHVIEAACFASPCSQYGQTVEACVVCAEGEKVTEAALIALCKESVGAFKAPRKIHFIDELPKGPSGKIQRLKIADFLSSLN